MNIKMLIMVKVYKNLIKSFFYKHEEDLFRIIFLGKAFFDDSIR